MVYPSKKDWWLKLLLVPICVALPAGGIFLLCLAVLEAGALPVLVPGLVMLAVGVFLCWAFVATECEINSSNLIIRFGPLRWRIPLERIADIIPRQGISAELAWGLAWSTDRVLIKYRKSNGRMALLAIAISPRDKDGFVLELVQAVPGLRRDDLEGRCRASEAGR
jgi:hypothetical protein